MDSIPFGFLMFALIYAWGICGVFAPKSWPRFFRFPTFTYSLNELPFLALLLVAGTTVLAIIGGDIYSPLGWLAFGLTVYVMLGLLVIIHFGLQTSGAVSHALENGLGPFWKKELTPAIANRLQKKFHLESIAGPLFIHRPFVKRVANIRYGNAGVRNTLDVYRNRSDAGNRPVIIQLHGGTFVRGKKSRQALPLLHRLARHGWVCVSANYRLSPSATFPDHLIDVKKVIAWVREHGTEYGADPSMIFVAGSSAGGHLASMAALTPNEPAFQPGFERTDTSVAGAVSLYGYYGRIDSRAALPSSPLAYSGEQAPPFFIVHGDRDSLVHPKNARQFAKHLRKTSGSPVVYAELPGADHVFDLFHSIRNEAVINGIEAFADWVIVRQEADWHAKLNL